MRVTIVLLLLALAAHTHAKVYDRCALARELKCYHNIPSNLLANWVCLAYAESRYDTSLTSNTSPSKGYGLFQIYDTYWCKSSAYPSTNDCGLDCSRLTDSYIGDDVACAKKIYARHGFSAWYGYKAKCEGKNLSSYTSGCYLTC